MTYALGSAAEDGMPLCQYSYFLIHMLSVALVFSAYIYYVVDPLQYERVTSYVKASALVACLLSGVLGDLVWSPHC